jgi:hypothetical protein
MEQEETFPRVHSTKGQTGPPQPQRGKNKGTVSQGDPDLHWSIVRKCCYHPWIHPAPPAFLIHPYTHSAICP